VTLRNNAFQKSGKEQHREDGNRDIDDALEALRRRLGEASSSRTAKLARAFEVSSMCSCSAGSFTS
jgi:hypothetical protein